MAVSELVAWALVLGGALGAIAAAQCFQFYVLRRWRTRARLPDPVAYTDAPSVRCDADIVLRVHSSKPVKITFHRCAGVGFTAEHILEAAASLQSRTMHRWHGFEWKTSAVVPAGTLAPGFYRVDVEHRYDASRRWCMCVLVRHVTAQPVIVVASTNTWNAYNNFGGLSNYQDSATPQPLRAIRALMRHFNIRIRVGDRHWIFAVPLPERRPNARIHRDLTEDPGTASHLVRAEAALIRFLERSNVAYTVISDRDFAYDVTTAETRLIIFNTHPEYWSDEMIGRLGESIDRGVSITFLAGNSLYRKVQFLQTAISVINMMTPQEEVVPLIGTYYDASGYGTHDAYLVVEAGHWCFDGIPVQEGLEFGHRTPSRPGASGGETDKIRPGAKGFRVIAIGKNPEGPAFMVCRDLPGGGFVFNVGSVAFTPSLDDDLVIQKLVLNLVRRALATGVSASTRVEPRRVADHVAT